MEVINYISGGDGLDDVLKKKLYKRPELIITLGLLLGVSAKFILKKITDYVPPEPENNKDVIIKKPKPKPELIIKPKPKINVEFDSFQINNVKICFTKIPRDSGKIITRINNEVYYRTGENYGKNIFILSGAVNGYDYKNITKIYPDFSDESKTGNIIYESESKKFKVLYFENLKKDAEVNIKIKGFYKIIYDITDSERVEEIPKCYFKLLADFINNGDPKSEVLHLDAFIYGFDVGAICRNIYNFIVTYEGSGFQLNLNVDKSMFDKNLENKIEMVDKFHDNKIVTISFHTKLEEVSKPDYSEISRHISLDKRFKTYRIYITDDFLELDIANVFDHFLKQSKYQNLDLNATKLNNEKWNPTYVIRKKIERTFNKLITHSEKYMFDRKIHIKNKIHKITEFKANYDINYNIEETAEMFFEIDHKDVKCKMYKNDDEFEDKKWILSYQDNKNLTEIFEYKSKYDNVNLLHIKLTIDPETKIDFDKIKPEISKSIRKMIDIFEDGKYTLLDLSTLNKYDTKINAASYQKNIIQIFKDEIKNTKPKICWYVKLPDSVIAGSGNYFYPIFIVFTLVLIVILLLLIIMYKFLYKDKYKYGTKSPEF